MEIYPTVTMEDSRGNKHKRHGDVPVKIRVSASEDRGSDAELAGQVAVKVYRILTRSVPGEFDSYSRIFFRGEEWDIAAPPIVTEGPSRLTRHVEFNIRSRNDTVRPGS